MDDLIMWCDLEATGSNEEKGDEIIEIGCILTTPDLVEIDSFHSLVKPGPLALGRMMYNPVVREMHEKNGLLAEILTIDPNNGLRPDRVSTTVLEWLARNGAQKDKTILAGSGVGHYDRRFIKKYMPLLDSYLRYWCIDIGVIRRAHEMWVPNVVVSSQNDNKTHRALDDAYCHLEEAREYKRYWNWLESQITR